MDKSEGSGVCDFQDKDCKDGFEAKEEEAKAKSNALSQESSGKKYVHINTDPTGAATGVPILDSVAANDL